MTALGRRRVKIVAVVSVWLAVAMIFILAFLPPATGYEISLYDALPLPVWPLAVLAIFSAQAGLLLQAFGTDREARSRIWMVLLATTVLVEVTLLVLPYLRGYPVYGRGDVLTHVGYVRSIDAMGTVTSKAVYPQDIYPNIHLLVLTLSYATGIQPLHVINAISPVVTAISVLSLWLLLDEVLVSRRKALAAMTFAALPIGMTAHVNPSPFAQSTLLLPLVLYLFVRSQRTGSVPFRAVMSVALVSLVIYHPLTTVFVVMIFFTYAVVRQLGLFRETLSGPSIASYITVSVFATWYLQFAAIVFKFRDTFDMFVAAGEGASALSSYSSAVERASPALIDLIRIATFKYGVSAVVLGMTGLYVLYAVYLWRKGRLALNRYGATLIGGALTFGAMSAVFFVQDFPVDYSRPLGFAHYLAVIPAGLLLYEIGAQPRRRRYLRPLLQSGIYATVLLLTLLTLFSLYYSPLATTENHQVTRMELSGSHWIYENGGDPVPVVSFGWGSDRHHHALYGIWNDTAPQLSMQPGVPAHFNYTEYPTLGDSYDRDTLLGISKLARIVYPKKFPGYEPLWAFTPADFDRLERDPSVDRIYANGEFDGYTVEARRAPPATNGTDVGTAPT